MERLTILKGFSNHLGTKAISVLVAVLIWFIIVSSRSIEAIKEIPIQVITADNVVVAGDLPEKVAFKLSGPKAFLRAVLDRRESPLQVNLKNNKPGTVSYRFFSDNIQVPIGIKVTSITPQKIDVKLESVSEKIVPVKVDVQGAPPEGYKIKAITLDSETVKISGAKSAVQQISAALTQPIDAATLTESKSIPALFSFEHKSLKVVGSTPQITIDVVAVSANFRIRNVNVKVKTALRYSVTPPKVTVFVRAREEDLSKLDETLVFAEIDLAEKNRGTFKKIPKVHLPKNVSLVKTVPKQIEVKLY